MGQESTLALRPNGCVWVIDKVHCRKVQSGYKIVQEARSIVYFHVFRFDCSGEVVTVLGTVHELYHSSKLLIPLDTCMAVQTQFTTALTGSHAVYFGTQKRSPFSHYFLLILHEESNGNEHSSARVTTSGRRTVVKVKCAVNSRNVPGLRPCPTCNAVLTSALTPRIPRTVYRYFWAYLFFTF